jgi:hypothetical protein
MTALYTLNFHQYWITQRDDTTKGFNLKNSTL